MPKANSLFGQMRDDLHRRFIPHRHTVLLVAIVVLFAARPLIGNLGFAPVVFSLALLALAVVALYTIQVDELLGERETLLAQKRRRSIIGWVLAVPAIVERLAIVFVHRGPIIIAGTISWFLLFSFVTWSELRAVVKQREVTGETIALSISVYLLLGLTWGILYIVLFYLQPNAFSFGGSGTPSAHPEVTEIFPVLIYFSLTTLSTVGFGDITPVSLQARYASVAEGITGQFYLAILVARLVGLYMSRPADNISTSGHQD
jgi:voltage-gated potassium channel